jgi:hypothetical protein
LFTTGDTPELAMQGYLHIKTEMAEERVYLHRDAYALY